MVRAMRRRVLLPIALAVLAVALAACSDGDRAPSGAATEASPLASGSVTAEVAPVRGIAGLVPPHHPTPAEADYRTFFGALAGLGGWAGTYVAWTPDGGIPEVVRTQPQVGEQFGYRTLPIIGFHQDIDGGMALTVDFTDPAQVAAYTDALVALAREIEPPYLGVGNEVNRLWEQDPAAYDAWVAALPAIADAVRAASPSTQVFVTFQYEFLRGAGALSGESRAPEWTLLDGVRDALDLVVFTTYPFFDFATPEEIPAEYYREGAERAGLPVAFSEVGWPSAPLAVAPESSFGGTEAEQEDFIARLSGLLADVDPVFVMWVWAYDSPATGPLFGSLGLSQNDGTPKPALGAWRRFLEQE